MSDPTPQVTLTKTVVEYPLPAAQQTHEQVAVGENLLLLSQQTDSSLVKVALDPDTGRPRAAAKHTVESPFAGLHGLVASQAYPGKVWATLQFDSVLLLLDPVADDLDQPPQVLQRIPLPAPARGPHGVIEHGDDLWTTCKDSSYIVRVNHREPQDISIYACGPRPIFAAIHPTSGDLYASLDQSSRIFRLVKDSGSTEEIAIPADQGSTPVGLIAGEDGNVWLVLLGGGSGGTGAFGRISANGEVTWFHLTSMAGKQAGLIHLAFDPHGENPGSRLWLLGSSMASHMAVNAVFAVTLADDGSRIASQVTISLPTPYSMTHRVMTHRSGLFVTELGVSVLAHIPKGTAALAETISETSDSYSLFGLGALASRVVYE